ncbi:MAG: PAAR-like domain-containing protein [Planctomycetota bacterium]
MFQISSTGGGMVSVTAPDVCKTPAPPAPPIPIPYPLTAQLAQASMTSTKVKLVNMKPLIQGSKIPSSMGDQAGSVGGVVSGVFGQECKPSVFSMKVKFEGKPVCRMTSLWQMNGSSANIVGQQAAPSQAKVTCS